MRVHTLRIEGRPYIEVMGLEVVLRDLADVAEQDGYPQEADGVQRVIAILEAVVKRERRVDV